ncbi:MAG: RhuM family protein [Euryarchaeota archaeon]|nr:RhuM family protein [Euryarchaeota archaeon]
MSEDKKENRLSIRDELTEFLLYTSPDGEVGVEVFLHNENIWLPQKRIAELFGTTKQNIGQHLKKIFEDGKLLEESVVKNFFTTVEDGKNYTIKCYNLDAIICVGYRVKSSKATKFRIRATKLLKDYIIKGFVLDDGRLKNGQYFGKDYFRELLERVRSIRASERRIYQQISNGKIIIQNSPSHSPPPTTAVTR